MNRPSLRLGAHAVVLALGLTIIFVPAVRGFPLVRWLFVLLYVLVMGHEMFRAFRSGLLSVPLKDLRERQASISAIHLLAAVCGVVALVLVL